MNAPKIIAITVILMIGMFLSSGAGASAISGPLGFEVLVDPDRTMSIEAVRQADASHWRKAEAHIVELPKIANLWLRFDLEVDATDTLFIENNWNIVIKAARMYALRGSQLAHIQPLRTHASLFSVLQERGRTTYYVQLEGVESPRIKTPIRVYTAQDYAYQETTGREITVLLYGTTLSMVLLCIVMMLAYRRIYFVYYVAYSLSMLGILAIGSFHVANSTFYLWPGLMFVNGVCASLFMRRVLNLRKKAKVLAWSMDGVLALFVLSSLVQNLTGIQTYSYLLQVMIYMLGATAAFVEGRRGSRPAILLFAGWAAFSAGYIINTLGMQYDLPPFVMYAAYLGFAVESVLFAIALILEVRQSETLALEQHDHAYKQLAKVLYPHQIEAIQSGRDLEMTMPTGEAEAALLCFDIIGSTAIRHEKSKVFFQNVFSACNEVMNRNYSPKNLTANAYRVKEMGDGFICSIGYPFVAIGDSLAESAVRVADELYAAFAREVQQFSYHMPIHCCIGIAMGHVAGFFPETGLKSYDLYGQGVVLATRYEAMRKFIMTESKGSLIILQEKVYASLAPEVRAQYQVFDLVENQRVVRDDPHASAVYFRPMGADQGLAVSPLKKSA